METENESALDKAFRYIYSTLRYKKYRMAIEFKHNGRVWRADTPDEAISLRKRLEAQDDAALAAGEDIDVVNTDWTPDSVTDLLKGAGDLQKRFLKLLYDKQNVTGTEAVKALKLDSEVALAGVLSGLSKRLKKTELQPGDLYSVSVQWTNDGKIRTFKLSMGFRRAAEQLGWPENWI